MSDQEIVQSEAPLIGASSLEVDKWTTWRITTDLRCADVFSKVDSIVAFEVSSKGVKHVHAITLGDRSDAIAKAIQRIVNKQKKPDKAKLWWSSSFPQSTKPDYTFMKGVSYTIKDGDYVFFGAMQKYIDRAPKWVHQDKEKDKEPVQSRIRTDQPDDKKLRDWQLTYTNLVCQAVQYRNKTNFVGDLKSTVADMLKNTRWRPSKWLITGGVPAFYENDFEVRVGKRAKHDMTWWTPTIRS